MGIEGGPIAESSFAEVCQLTQILRNHFATLPFLV